MRTLGKKKEKEKRMLEVYSWWYTQNAINKKALIKLTEVKIQSETKKKKRANLVIQRSR